MLDLGSLVWICFNPQVKYSNQEEFSLLTSFLHMLSSSVRNVVFPVAGDVGLPHTVLGIGNGDEADVPVDERRGALVSSVLFLHANANRCCRIRRHTEEGKLRKRQEDSRRH